MKIDYERLALHTTILSLIGSLGLLAASALYRPKPLPPQIVQMVQQFESAQRQEQSRPKHGPFPPPTGMVAPVPSPSPEPAIITNVMEQLRGAPIPTGEELLWNLSKKDTVFHAFITDGKEWKELGKDPNQHSVRVSQSDISDFIVRSEGPALYYFETRPRLSIQAENDLPGYLGISLPLRMSIQLGYTLSERSKSYDKPSVCKVISPDGIVDFETAPLPKNPKFYMLGDPLNHHATHFNPEIDSIIYTTVISTQHQPKKDIEQELNKVYAGWGTRIKISWRRP